METPLQQVNLNIHKSQLSFAGLGIESSVLEDYIGFTPGEAPEPFPEIIADIFSRVRHIRPEGGYVIYEGPVVALQYNKIVIRDIEFETQGIVTRQFANSSAMAVFACTAGPEISQLAREYDRQGNSVHAYLIDSLGSIIVEKAMDAIQENLKGSLMKGGLHITNRYSPGYCDWDIREQKKLFELLPENFCGISLLDSMLMKPIKSISGFIGIGSNVTFNRYTCNYCKDRNCLYRNKR